VYFCQPSLSGKAKNGKTYRISQSFLSVKERDIVRKLSPKKMVWPILIGLGVATFMLVNNLNDTRFVEVHTGICGDYNWLESAGKGIPNLSDAEEFEYVGDCLGTYRIRTYKDTLGDINWGWHSTFWLVLALLAMVTRDLAYIYRIKVLTDHQLGWRQSFRVIMLWEFASALSPSIVGGSGVAMFIVNREGIKLGKSTAIVLVSALLDELFYIVMVVVVLLIIGTAQLFPVSMQMTFFGTTFGTKGIFWIGYTFIFLMTSAILLGIFTSPRSLKYLLLQFFRFPFLRRWRYQVIEVGDDIITTSRELRGKPIQYWTKSMGATFASWIARYWVVNFLILAFANPAMPLVDGFGDHLLIFARQLVMWVIMLISPTPGSAGVAEFAFSGFLGDFIPLGLAAALAMVWRLVSYYPYLFVGAIVLPRWLKSTARQKKSTAQ
jgi:hypothetical protein